MAIIAILAVAIVPNLMNRVSDSKIVRVKQDITSIESALELYKLDTGNYPLMAQGLAALEMKPTTSNIPNSWNGPYLKKLQKDPWGNSYQYVFRSL